MNEQQIAFWKVINDLSEIGVLEHVAIICCVSPGSDLKTQISSDTFIQQY